MKGLRVWLASAGKRGKCPSWYQLSRAARWLGCTPWELEQQDARWLYRALAGEGAESWAEAETAKRWKGFKG